MLELLIWPFVAGLVLAGIHAWFGLHVLARGVVFVDLSLAQSAALGLTVAILSGHAIQSEAAYWYAVCFAVGGAILFALVRPYEKALQQEAVIGIVYAVSASLGILVLDRAPQGAEHIKQLMIGQILTVTPGEVASLAMLYGVIGAVHVLLRRPLVAASFHAGPAGAGRPATLLWDIVFYGSFALVVTSSVRIAGVLLVFSYLIVPAAMAGLLVRGLLRQLLLAWGIGAGLTAVGLAASWVWDLPTGPAIVAAFGAGLALLALAFAVRKLTGRSAGIALSLAALLIGAPLAAVPQMDQPWLDALEHVAPPVQTAFLEKSERAMRLETLGSVERTRAELARLRSLEQDVRWGRVAMDAERAERLRQYLAGRSEIGAGEQMVLNHLRRKARDRQRLALGLPLAAIGGACLLVLLGRRGRT